MPTIMLLNTGYTYDDGVLRTVESYAGGKLSAAQREVLLVAMTNVSVLGGWDAEDSEEAQRSYLSAVLSELQSICDMEWDDGHRLRRADMSRADAEAVLSAFRAAYPSVEAA